MKRKLEHLVEDRLLRRELGDHTRYANIPGIYGDRRFVKDLDIVNELAGHTGCVNALSWSTSGNILASGSDDKVINLYSYLPESSPNQFDLATQLYTGHSRNIFSVKFMPHTNDRKLVSCAGDGQVRVFDIQRGSILGGDRSHLSGENSSTKVFRSHGGPVKRIVTEASPFYFLTCSEDGNVRQWDIRQPESTYPRSRNTFYPSDRIRDVGDAPPPLISYADYNIDLYTLSCSPRQPHYIALGGTHLHVFLHDRRMLGRNKMRERGGLLSPSPTSDSDVNAMMEATRCVRKFAPHGQPTMNRVQSSQITACKISNANPNELIASWSGDYIYSFDISRDERESANMAYKLNSSRSLNKGQKRKRASASPSIVSQEAVQGGHSASRTEASEHTGSRRTEKVSVIVRLRNGEQVELPIDDADAEDSEQSSNQDGAERPHSLRIAQGVVGLKSEMLIRHATENGSVHYTRDDDLSDREDAMVKVVCEAAAVFEMIDDAITHWAYPVTHSTSQVAFQQKLRDDRAKAWRFVQAAGTIARVLLKLSPHNNDKELPKSLDYFDMIRPAPRESSRPLDEREQFCYDFIKAVLLWLDSGIGAVLREFTADSDDMQKYYPRRQPVTKNAESNAIEEELIPYLRRLATEKAVVDVDPDADDENHVLFETEISAVNALERVMRIPFADLHGESAAQASEAIELTRLGVSQPRDMALKFWGMRVCRTLLATAAIDVDFACVDTAFDGVAALGLEGDNPRSQSSQSRAKSNRRPHSEPSQEPAVQERDEDDGGEGDDDMALDTDSEHGEHNDDGEESDEEEDEEDAPWPGARRVIRARRSAGKGVPCSTHTRLYRGHCNLETTKDVNYYGLQDEYVVSGSDCGHVFIWDKQTAELVTILQGDGEVVNVVQAHPYEPMLAVSGIDHTIKIFSPDGRARRDAANGIGIRRSDQAGFSSLGFRTRRRLAQRSMATAGTGATRNTSEPAVPDPNTGEDDTDAEQVACDRGLASARRMHQAYQITSQNDMDRRLGTSSQYVSRSMLSLLMARFSQEFPGWQFGLANLDDDDEDGEGGDDDVGDD